MKYGGKGTIHQTTEHAAGVRDGKVVSVWFRCAPLPFKQVDVGAERAADMTRMYAARTEPVHLIGVEIAE